MKRITCFIGTMGCGGAEHQLAILTSMLSRKGYKVELVTYGGKEDHYPIDNQVKRIRIANTSNRIGKFLSIFWFFLTHSTDCVISFTQRVNLFTLIPLLFRPKIKVIAGERNFTVAKQDLIEKVLFRYLYKRADYIVPNSYSQGEYIASKQSNLAKKVVTIINYTDVNQYEYLVPQKNDITKIGIFCRYHKQKNYERFAKVVKMLKDAGYVLQVDWYGNKEEEIGGDNRDYLHFRALVENYCIDDVISLNDHIKNVSDMMPKYDAICVPSLYEGWSNTISEGICCGRPMLVGDVSDNGRMVKHQENGFLFNPKDEESMYDAFAKFLMMTYTERVLMGEKSRQLANELFHADRFVNSYISLIEK